MVQLKRYSFKILIVGDGGVGKTSLLHRYIYGEFLPMKMTIGTDIFSSTKIFDNNIKFDLQFWDFAGEARFRFFLPSYCRGAKACLLCYDLTRESSFHNLPEWYNIVRSNADNPYFILVGCKYDMDDKYKLIHSKTANKFKDEYNIDQFFETSSKTGYNNQEIFDGLLNLIYNCLP